MFYSQSLLSRKGPLGNIWIAAYCFKKLKKHQIDDIDITSSIDKIIPEVQISYRVLAQLLLGVVKIFSKKVDYLYHDCNVALTNIRKSFIPTNAATQRKAGSEPHRNAPKKANSEPKHHALVGYEITHSPKQNAAAQEGGLAMQIEAICAPYHDVTIAIPECFDLDAFNLDVVDGGDTVKLREEPIHEDEWTKEKDQHFFQNECHHKEVDLHAEYNSTCFSPMDDIFPSNMMDFEINEFNNSSGTEVRGRVEESKSCGGLKAYAPVGTSLRDEQQERHVYLVTQQDEILPDTQREVQIEEPKDQMEQANFCDAAPTHVEGSQDLSEGNSAKNLNKPPDKSNAASTLGLPSPKFAVTTPARKETNRISRKRKTLFDETIVLSNEIMRMWIHDASSLVCKRRKVPFTYLDAWRTYRITYLQQNLTEPDIPYISSEHRSVFRKELSDYLPQKKSTRSTGGDSVNSQIEIPCKITEPHDALHERTHSETPPPANYSDICTPDRSEVRMKESSPIELPTPTLDVMDKELDSTEKESGEQGGGWSVRTRAVAKYLYDKFVGLKEQKRKENLNLSRILEGQTRSKSARFFYETLVHHPRTNQELRYLSNFILCIKKWLHISNVMMPKGGVSLLDIVSSGKTLKSYGCIDVEQDCPYADIIISSSHQLEAFIKNR